MGRQALQKLDVVFGVLVFSLCSTGLSRLALWPRGHITGIPGRMITQSTVIRYRTGPLSPLITSQSKFTPIENSQNSCHGGQWTNALFTRYRTPNIPVMAPTLAVVWHLGVPDPAHHSPRLASDCLSHQPSMHADSSLPPSYFDHGTRQGFVSEGCWYRPEWQTQIDNEQQY